MRSRLSLIAICAGALCAVLTVSSAGSAAPGTVCSSPAGAAACAGTARAPFVTPGQARAAYLALWKVHERALDTHNLHLMRQVDTGSEALVDTYTTRNRGPCGCGGADAAFYPTHGPRSAQYVSIYFPQQDHYPLYFLAQTNTEGAATYEANVLQLVTKASPKEPWRLAVAFGDTGYRQGHRALPPPIPDAGHSLYLQHVFKPTPAQAGAWPRELARYWLALKKQGRPPAATRILPGPLTTGTDLLLRREGVNSDGMTHHFRFTVSGGPWIFRIGGITWACTDIAESGTMKPTNPLLSFVQPADRSTFGATVRPGRYASITYVYDWPVCLYSSPEPANQHAVGVYGFVETGTAMYSHATPLH